MTLKAPKCKWCGRWMPGANASREFCSVGCEVLHQERTDGDKASRKETLADVLDKWRKRAEGEPTYVDRAVERRSVRRESPAVDAVDTGRTREEDGPPPWYITRSGVKRGHVPGDGPAEFRDATNTLAQGAVASRLATRVPEVGDEALIPCPHCDGPMTVIAVIPPDSITIECPSCAAKDKRRQS